jgi:cell division protease FtsH
MKKWLLYFLIAALAISYGLYAVQHLWSPVWSPSIAWISTWAIATWALADEWRTAIVQTTEVDLNSFLNLYQQNTFSKVLLKDGITLEWYETTATWSVSNFLINALGIKVDTKYNLVTTTKPADTSLNELWFTLTWSDTTPVTVIYNKSGFFEKVFLEQIVPLLFFVLLIVLFMRMMGSKMWWGMPFNFKAWILRTNADVKTKFTDVAGMDEVKQELIEIVDYLSNPKKYLDVWARIPKGVLLRWPPWSGKTLLARAVAGEAGVPFYSASGSEFMEMLVGMGAAKVRELFKKAKASAPSIIFIDEIDTIGRKRGSWYTWWHQEQEQTLNQILTEMDGFEKDNNVIVIAATNRPDTLDSALLRPGRFDRKVFVWRPTLEERTMILQYYLKNKKINIDFDVESLAKRMSGFVGADLENVVNEAALKVAKDNRKMLTMEDFEYAFEKVIMGPEKKIKTLKEKERNIVAYHELGHAVTARNLENCDPVEKISIVSRGMALGVTWMIPDEERYLYSKAKFMDEIVSLLGGRAAEELFFGKDEITTGASNDFEKVHRIVYDMLLKYGMDEELGTIMYHDESKGEYHSFRPYSEKLAEQIDEKVKTIVKDRYQQSLKILAANKALIEKMKTYLLYVEYINKEEFSNIMTNPEVIDDMIASMEAKMEAKKAQQEQQSKQKSSPSSKISKPKRTVKKKSF